MRIYDRGEVRVFEVAADGPPIESERDAIDIMGEIAGDDSDLPRLVAIPTVRLAPDFLRLKTGLAGAFIQKFVNYGVHLAFFGNIDEEIANSDALAAFMAESNRGTTVWFVQDIQELERRLG